MPTPMFQKTARFWRYMTCLAVMSCAAAALGLQTGPNLHRRLGRFEPGMTGYVPQRRGTSVKHSPTEHSPTELSTTGRSTATPLVSPHEGLLHPYTTLAGQARFPFGNAARQHASNVHIRTRTLSGSELPEIGAFARIKQQVPELDDEELNQRTERWVENTAKMLEEPKGEDSGDERPFEDSEEVSELNTVLMRLRQRLSESKSARAKVDNCLEKLQLFPKEIDAGEVCQGERDEVFDHCVKQVERWVANGKLSSVFNYYEVPAVTGYLLFVPLPNPPSDFLFYARLLRRVANGPCREFKNEDEIANAVASLLYTVPAAVAELSAGYRQFHLPMADSITRLLTLELLARLFFRYAYWFVNNPRKLVLLNQACRSQSICRRLVRMILHTSPPMGDMKAPPAMVRWFASYLKLVVPNRGGRVMQALAPLVAETLASSLHHEFPAASQPSSEGDQKEPATPLPRQRQSVALRLRKLFNLWRRRRQRRERNQNLE
ncbi:conserved hypothetical protein [Neospora caninum Liverpool]|uniref:Uncharacterized protein n=1 Tax=Neospora caninum (strain Liverpool) TaxID=572307 RepID=F0VNB0_NEOCL|nr:conserved hypothetical protein [Neospora caninum Liverpool]CBZ55206.1 conserved hypothetical protein [Neospora caninum Liverpool]CEL69933.1 TPA: hypothetical protein BN1204_056300 [Neospora caninum Liverpool]|eukprot:XP_003885234.1 conserved hypothetical protein [Neospora caninum Liverpool]